MKSLVAAVGLLVVFALPASAQQVKLQISDGRVTLDAVNATARQILAEWARIGGTNIVGADKITGGGLTLKLNGMPEQQALDIILRNVAGFMAAPRRTQAAAGASTYDRILIMATSASAAQAASASRPGMPGAAGNALNGTQRRVPGVPPRPPSLPTPPEDADDPDDPPDTADTGVAPVFTFPGPQPGQPPGANNPVFVPMQNSFGSTPGNPNQNPNQPPVITLQPGPNGPTIYNFVPNSQHPPATTTPNAPFSVIGSPTPGMIQAPPPQPAPAPGTQKPPR
jgi:hypothetical protein